MNVSPDAHMLQRAVVDCIEPGPVLVGCSGGPDSIALAASAHWAAPRIGAEVAVVIVDHGLQSDSADVAEGAAQACRALGLSDVEVCRVEVGVRGGPEAAARVARRAALQDAALRRGSHQILLAHTRDDQAETVLLRLARGSGARSLAAMRSCDAPWHRPFLGIARGIVHQVAREYLDPLGLTPWDDPHNHDRAFARVRVRRSMDLLEADLGPGIAEGLARTARLLGDDADALDTWAFGEFERLVSLQDGTCSVDLSALVELPRAVRTRVIRLMHRQLVGIDEALTFDHIQHVESMVTRWSGQGPARLPGLVTAEVDCGRLCLTVHGVNEHRES